MTDDEAYAAYLEDVICTKALPLFGALLRLVCTRAGISQRRLEEDAKAWLRPGEKLDIYQPTIAKASKGKLEPSLRQLRYWLRAIRKVYEDPNFPQECLINRVACYDFPRDLEMDMRRLALKAANDDDIAKAYERRRNMVLELTRVEWRNGIVPRYNPIEAKMQTDIPTFDEAPKFEAATLTDISYQL